MCVCVLTYPYHKPWYHLTLRQAEAATALPSLVTLASSALAPAPAPAPALAPALAPASVGIENFVPAGTDHGERVCRPPIGGLIHVPSPTSAAFLIVGDDPMLCTLDSQRRKSLCCSIVTPQFFLTVAQESSGRVSYTSSWVGCIVEFVEILGVDFDVHSYFCIGVQCHG